MEKEDASSTDPSQNEKKGPVSVNPDPGTNPSMTNEVTEPQFPDPTGSAYSTSNLSFWQRVTNCHDPTFEEEIEGDDELQAHQNVRHDVQVLHLGLIIWVVGLGLAAVALWLGFFMGSPESTLLGLLFSIGLTLTVWQLGYICKVSDFTLNLSLDSLHLGALENARFPESYEEGMWLTLDHQMHELRKWGMISGLALVTVITIFSFFASSVLSIEQFIPDGLVVILSVLMVYMLFYGLASYLTALDRLKCSARILGRLVGQGKVGLGEPFRERLNALQLRYFESFIAENQIPHGEGTDKDEPLHWSAKNTGRKLGSPHQEFLRRISHQDDLSMSLANKNSIIERHATHQMVKVTDALHRSTFQYHALLLAAIPFVLLALLADSHAVQLVASSLATSLSFLAYRISYQGSVVHQAESLHVHALQLGLTEAKDFPEDIQDDMVEIVARQVRDLSFYVRLSGICMVIGLVLVFLLAGQRIDPYLGLSGLFLGFVATLAFFGIIWALAGYFTALIRLEQGGRILGRLVGSGQLDLEQVIEPAQTVKKRYAEEGKTPHEITGRYTYQMIREENYLRELSRPLAFRPYHRRASYTSFMSKQLPSVALVYLLVIFAMGAATGLVLKDQITGTTTVAVTQGLYFENAPTASGNYLEFLGKIDEDGASVAAHFEAQNGATFTLHLQVNSRYGIENIPAILYIESAPPQINFTFGPEFWYVDSDHDGVADAGEARLLTKDRRLEENDNVVVSGKAALTAFEETMWFFDGHGLVGDRNYNDDIFTDHDGVSPEAILQDNGNGWLDPGPLYAHPDKLVVTGYGSLGEDVGYWPAGPEAVGRLFFSDIDGMRSQRWDPEEDLFLNQDGDFHFTKTPDTLVDADGTATIDSGILSPPAIGSLLTPFDSQDMIYWYDSSSDGTFKQGDVLWLDYGQNGLFNANGESLGGADPAQEFIDIPDPSIDISLDGEPAETYLLENVGRIIARTPSTLGLEAVAPGSFQIGNLTRPVNQSALYLITQRSADLHQGSTVTLIGDVATSGNELAGDDLLNLEIQLGQPLDLFVQEAQNIDSLGRLQLMIDDGNSNLVDASLLKGGQALALDSDGTLNGNEVLLIVDSDGGQLTDHVWVLGQPEKGLPDNLELYSVNISDGSTLADLDDHYLSSGQAIATSLQAALGDQAKVSYNAPEHPGAFQIQSNLIHPSLSSVIVSPGSVGTDISFTLKLGVWGGGFEAGPDQVIRGSARDDESFGLPVVTDSVCRFSFLDLDEDGGYDLGETIFEEETGGAGTYSPESDILLYSGLAQNVNGGQPGLAGSTAQPLQDLDNVMFLDVDNDGGYDLDLPEPLLHTGTTDLQPGDLLVPSIEVLPRHQGNWPNLMALDMHAFASYSGSAIYRFSDLEGDGEYDESEAILNVGPGQTHKELEQDDVVIHKGIADMKMASEGYPKADKGDHSWYILVPSDNEPLDLDLTIEIPYYAPTGFYEFSINIQPMKP